MVGFPPRGGRPRTLIPGEGVREGLAWRGGLGGAGRSKFRNVCRIFVVSNEKKNGVF